MLSKKNNKNLNIFIKIFPLLFIILVWRLSYLQIYQGEQFAEKAESNRIRLNPITAPRGFFYDRNGKVLVKNRPAFTVSIVPMDLRKNSINQVIRKTSEILQIPEDEIRQKIKERAPGSFEAIKLKIDVSQETVIKIEERKSELPGVIIETDAIREYPRRDWASLLFGYVGEINADELKLLQDKGYRIGDTIGKMGLEKVLDPYLKGEVGGRQVEVNAMGHPIRVLGIKPPKKGNDIVLTIDAKIQSAAENAVNEKFGGNKGVAIVVMDTNTGEILAFVSKPGFDPNKFATGISKEDYQSLITNPLNPFRNRVIQNAYPPGSVFKIITGIAALEEKKTTAGEVFYDRGYYPPIPIFTCMHRHGSIDFISAYAKSCNVVFYTLGDRVGIDKLDKYAAMFGLGRRTGIDLLSEIDGLLPTPEWKKRAWHERWYRGDTLNTSIGQGNNLYTPIQLVRMMSAVANGGKLLKPLLVKEIRSNGRLVKRFDRQVDYNIPVSQQTLDTVKKGLRAVVERGTAQIVNIPGLNVAGKTGTAQATRAGDHAWFACFAPVDKPRIAVVAFVENGGHGGSEAGPLARKALEAAFNIGQPGNKTIPTTQSSQKTVKSYHKIYKKNTIPTKLVTKTKTAVKPAPSNQVKKVTVNTGKNKINTPSSSGSNAVSDGQNVSGSPLAGNGDSIQ